MLIKPNVYQNAQGGVIHRSLCLSNKNNHICTWLLYYVKKNEGLILKMTEGLILEIAKEVALL